VAPACLVMPSTPVGWEALRQGVLWWLTPITVLQPHPCGGEGAGNMAEQDDPFQLESERELCPHTTGYSSELMRGIAAN
jgi:hypothetical protein